MTEVENKTGEPRRFLLGRSTRPYQLLRSSRRTLEIAVTALGMLEVRAPEDLSVAAIEARLRAHARWIRSRLSERDLGRPNVVPRSYVSGESHRYLGRQYRLQLTKGRRSTARISSGRLIVTVPTPEDPSSIRRALERWYLARAKELLRSRLDRVLACHSLEGTLPSGVRIQRMRQRWGSCSSSGRLLLNTELMLLPPSLIDYVLIHELVHLRVRSHGAEFERHMARALPEWRTRHDQLTACRFD